MSSSQRRFYRGGVVYSAADPFATAMVVDGGTIAWLGPEEGAGPWVSEDDEVVDLAGRLVTPAFVELLGAPGAAAAAGVVPVPLEPPGGGERIRVAPQRIEDPVALAAQGVGVVAVPGPGEPPEMDLPLSELAAAGVVLALSSGPGDPRPWAAVRAAVLAGGGARGISARAAFLAHTRGALRLAGRPEPGVLLAGAPATYAVWDVGELVVQTPDGRLAAWSTDARAGTPMLPDLVPGAPLPVCRRTVARGRVTYDTLRGA